MKFDVYAMTYRFLPLIGILIGVVLVYVPANAEEPVAANPPTALALRLALPAALTSAGCAPSDVDAAMAALAADAQASSALASAEEAERSARRARLGIEEAIWRRGATAQLRVDLDAARSAEANAHTQEIDLGDNGV